jgi:hypothetical protein
VRQRAGRAATPIEFLESPRYLNAKSVLYPKNVETYEEICLSGKPETILTGAIGWGKNTLVSHVNAYFVYLLSREESPHSFLGLDDPSSEILIVYQSDTLASASDIGYDRFRALVENSPYFNERFPFDRKLKSSTVFPNRIEVLPVAGDGAGVRGRNVVSACIDELAYMETVEKSRRSSGMDGRFDQAEMLYAIIARRRISRFLRDGSMPGHLFLVSSKNHRGQFLERKIREAKQHPERIALYDRRLWDVDPDRYCGETFRVFVGDSLRNPRVLLDAEVVPESDRDLVEFVPVEMRPQFETDPFGATRDLVGVSTNAVHPFMLRSDLVAACFDHHESIFAVDWTDLVGQEPEIDERLVARYRLRDEPHALHVDLALTQDSAGLALGCVTGFIEIQRGEGVTETLPRVIVPGILEIRPPRGGEIRIEAIRKLIYAMRDHSGINISWVSFDQYQSADARQQLRAQGFWTQVISVDRTTEPYDMLKSTIYDGRLIAPPHTKCQHELLRLTRDTANPTRPKIDHQPGGSKDCADALCGVVWSVTRKREVWARHRIPLSRVPASVYRSEKRMERSADPM